MVISFFLLISFLSPFPCRSFILINFFRVYSLNGNRFVHKSKFVGVNFPPNGPVMQKKTLGWERSIEKMTVRNGALEGNLTMFLMLEGGGNYRCEYRSIYKYVGRV